MSNRQYVKKRLQNKSYSPSSGGCSNYLSQDDLSGIESNSMAPIYEQIKSEVVSSVLNWLSMYMAADQEDKKVNAQIAEPVHCCECTINRRSEKSNRSSLNSPFSNIGNQSSFDFKSSTFNNDGAKFTDVSTFTGEDNNSRSTATSDIPEDSNMVITDFKAGQVWPDWCQYLEKALDKHSTSNLANSQVYYDKFNDRLCVYRRGLVEYPQLNKKSPRIETSCLTFKQNLKSIPEARESLVKSGFFLNNKSKGCRMSHLNETSEFFSNPDHKNIYSQNENSSGFDSNQLPEYQMYENYPQNMVKWMSLPNVQFNH